MIVKVARYSEAGAVALVGLGGIARPLLPEATVCFEAKRTCAAMQPAEAEATGRAAGLAA